MFGTCTRHTVDDELLMSPRHIDLYANSAAHTHAIGPLRARMRKRDEAAVLVIPQTSNLLVKSVLR